MAKRDLDELVVEYKQEPCEDTINEIFSVMEPFIQYWCQTQCYLPWEKEDILQVARIAVLGAIDRFDTEKGIRFKTFAYKTISGKILNYYRDSTWRVGIPRKYRELSSYITKAEREIYQDTGENPEIKDIAAKIGISEKEVERVMEAKRAARVSSLSEQLEKEDRATNKTELIQLMGAEDKELIGVELKQDLINALNELDEKKRAVIYMRFFEDLTQSKVAEILNVSQMQVSRLERMALEELKGLL